MIYFLGNKDLFSDDINYCTEEQILEYCRFKPKLGLDIETTRKYAINKYKEDIYKPGLDPYMTKICMLQIGDLNNQFVIDVRTHSIEFLKTVLEDESVLKVGHNLKFEGKHILLGYSIFIKNVWDTMICERILYNGEPIKYSLQALAGRYLGILPREELSLFEEEEVEDLEPVEELDDLNFLDYKEKIYIDKSIRTNFINIGSRPFTLDEIKYGVNDIIYPLQIQSIQNKGRLIDGELYNPINGFYTENKFTQVLAKIELRGIKVYQEKWKEVYKKNKQIHTDKIGRLDLWVQKNHPKFATQYDLFNSEPTCSIMWSSPAEVIKFAKYLGICPKEKSKFTGTEEYTVGAKAMFKLLTNENKEKFYKDQEIEFQDKNDTQAFILNFLLSKKYQQLTTTFGLEWLRFIHPITGKVHTNFIQLMNTGRMSSTSPNLQQIPSGKVWREMFISEDNKNLVSTDFSAQEVRIAAEVTKVKNLQDLFIHGHPIFKKDVHSLTATNMFKIITGDPEWICDPSKHKKERNVAKAMIFKILYGKKLKFVRKLLLTKKKKSICRIIK